MIVKKPTISTNSLVPIEQVCRHWATVSSLVYFSKLLSQWRHTPSQAASLPSAKPSMHLLDTTSSSSFSISPSAAVNSRIPVWDSVHLSLFFPPLLSSLQPPIPFFNVCSAVKPRSISTASLIGWAPSRLWNQVGQKPLRLQRLYLPITFTECN